MDILDQKLNEFFPGKVVRKDLVHQIKKAANVPSFVLEFLLSKYCATDDPEEIEAGKKTRKTKRRKKTKKTRTERRDLVADHNSKLAVKIVFKFVTLV